MDKIKSPAVNRLFWIVFAVTGIIAVIDLGVFLIILNEGKMHIGKTGIALFVVRLLLFGTSPFTPRPMGFIMLALYVGLHLLFINSAVQT